MIDALLLGLLLGLRHALESDHVAAVATLATRARSWRDAAGHGAAWGLGHGTTLLLVGGAALALGLAIPDRLASVLEVAVGCLLLALGADVVHRVWREPLHAHVHRHGEMVHAHLHRHPLTTPHDAAAHRHAHPAPLGLRAALVGSMQGVAGSGAIVVLLAQSVRTPLAGLGTLLAFGLGSVLGMAALSLCIAVPMRFAAARRLALPQHMILASGVVSIVVGAAVIVRWTLGHPIA